MIPAELTTLLTGLDGLVLPAVDALVKVTLVLGQRRAGGRRARSSVGGSASPRLEPRACERARHPCALVRASSLAAADRHPDGGRGACAVPASDNVPSAPPLSRRTRAIGPSSLAASSRGSRRSSCRHIAPTSNRFVLPRISVTKRLLAIWVAGVVAVLARLLLGLVAVQWMSRRTVRVVDAPWLPLAEELADDLGITRRLTFLESARASMPMAAGVFSPPVLMPEDANRWPLERLRIVLLHELAHVKRRDCLTHVIAQTRLRAALVQPAGVDCGAAHPHGARACVRRSRARRAAPRVLTTRRSCSRSLV